MKIGLVVRRLIYLDADDKVAQAIKKVVVYWGS